MEACLYASDPNDAEWALLEALIPRSHPAGRRQIYRLRRIVDAIFYLLRTGAHVGRHRPSRTEGLAAQSAGLEAVRPSALVDRRGVDAGWIRAANAPERLSSARAKVSGCLIAKRTSSVHETCTTAGPGLFPQSVLMTAA
jgi:transposase